MKKEVQINTEKVITINDLTDTSHVGFVAFNGEKGYIAKIHTLGTTGFSAIALDSNGQVCNKNFSDGGYSIRNAIENIADCAPSYRISKLYLFDTRKELYKWLAED